VRLYDHLQVKFQLHLLSTSQSLISRVLCLLSTDPTIGSFPSYHTLRHDDHTNGVGYWLLNHVLSNRPCLLSPTWCPPVLPPDYWSIDKVQNRFSIELVYIDASIVGMKGNLKGRAKMNDEIDGKVSTYQMYLKQTRRSILDISHKVNYLEYMDNVVVVTV